MRCFHIRDAWDSVKGTTVDDAQQKYVEKLLDVSQHLIKRSTHAYYFLLSLQQILKKTENEDSKKYAAEIEAA